MTLDRILIIAFPDKSILQIVIKDDDDDDDGDNGGDDDDDGRNAFDKKDCGASV